MTQTFPQSPEPSLAPSNPANSQPTAPNPSPEDHDLLTTLALKDSLGAVLTKQGKFSEAATLLTEVLTARESLNESPTSPGMLRTMNNLAAALQHQDNFASAESLFRRVLESDMQTQGISSPDTLTTMNNLANVLVDQGQDKGKDNAKLSEAAELLQRALQLSQEVNGPRSPKTLSMMGNQVNILIRQEKYEQAERVAREVLALRREVLRPQHPEIETAMHNLAVALRKVGKVDESEALRREEQALREADDKERVDLVDGDGQVAIEEGRYEEAESIFRNALVKATA